jgi:tripartite-type tricarboxylate transporter receptor subunit TctC
MKSLMLVASVVAAGLALSPAISNAQSYPTKAVKMIVPLAPGGGTDVSARVLAKQLSSKFGQQFFVEAIRFW